MSENLTPEEEDALILKALQRRVVTAREDYERLHREAKVLENQASELRTRANQILKDRESWGAMLRQMSPEKSKEGMEQEVYDAVVKLLHDTPEEEYAVSAVVRALDDMALMYAARGFEARVRAALTKAMEFGLVKRRQVETKTKQKAWLWSARMGES